MASRPSRTRIAQLFAVVVVAGVTLHLLLSVSTTASGAFDSLIPFASSQRCAVNVNDAGAHGQLDGPMDNLEVLRGMVANTKGYYVRDWSLGLGWNNMRYIIEASLLHATLLQRTLVLPSFVYARACEHNITVCAEYAVMVNRGEAIGWNDWSDLPIEQQMGWRIPIEVMLNITSLRRKYNVITFLEYLDLKGLPHNIEWGSGMWDRNGYLATTPRTPFFMIPNIRYDPPEIVRVDTYPDTNKQIKIRDSDNAARLEAAREGKTVLDWDAAKAALVIPPDADVEQAFKDSGWVVLHTFEPFLGMEFVKSPVLPVRQVAPHWAVRGLVEDWGAQTEEVLLLEGEVHLSRKPGSLRFTTAAARDEYMRLCLQDLKYLDSVRVVADRVAERMQRKVGGRMWMSAQMRRGDFSRAGWAMEQDVPSHYARVQNRLSSGRALLTQLQAARDHVGFPVPDVVPDLSPLDRDVPREGDPVYIATDERDPNNLAFLRANGAVLIHDLLEVGDRQLVGWPLLVTDVLALVEQHVLSHSDFFYGHAMSSVAGGVVNMRAARGADRRTYLID